MTVDELAARLGDPELAILDVRTAVEYSGERGYPCDPRQGHVPGARHLDVTDLVDRAAEELRALMGLPESAEIAVYCHSGSRSAMAAAALRAAGYDARNVPGSWHEWSRRAELPAEQA
jgi:thiosulfate/3-mercaptopyruvate sulfurtransferase